AGIPPLSGFVPKFALVEAGVDVDEYAIVAVSLVVSLLTLFSMTKIWAGVFWGTPDEPSPEPIPPSGTIASKRTMVLSTGALVLLSLVIAAGAGPVYELSSRAAAGLFDPAGYVALVLGE
ncbi:MAG: Na+/H+ antiporter subunit D, partial [Actinomycetota bacterium]